MNKKQHRFVETMTINNKPVIFRFEKIDINKYKVSSINQKSMEPFYLIRASGNAQWKSEGKILPGMESCMERMIEALNNAI